MPFNFINNNYIKYLTLIKLNFNNHLFDFAIKDIVRNQIEIFKGDKNE